jgi:hypothetical protein
VLQDGLLFTWLRFVSAKYAHQNDLYNAMTITFTLSWLIRKGVFALDIGRLATGYGMGALSYAVRTLHSSSSI